MKISEIFYSIQGEGTLVGMPSVFIRTSGCNLRCTWCDTPYTSWYPEGNDVDISRVVEEVHRHRARHVVVTGGEPMIAPEVGDLTRQLRARGMHITMETAGTMLAAVECDLMSISPKLASSTPRDRDGGRWAAQHDRLRIQVDVLKELITRYPYQVKFVVTTPEDLSEVRPLVERIGADRDRVLLMPEGTERETLLQRSQWLVEICKAEGFRYSPRLHIDLFGNRRGV